MEEENKRKFRKLNYINRLCNKTSKAKPKRNRFRATAFTNFPFLLGALIHRCHSKTQCLARGRIWIGAVGQYGVGANTYRGFWPASAVQCMARPKSNHIPSAAYADVAPGVPIMWPRQRSHAAT